MGRPPARLPPQPIGNRLALMRVDPIPLHFYRYVYNTIGFEWTWVERRLMSDDDLAAKIHKPGVELSVLYGNGSPAGFFELDFSAEPIVDLAYFGLFPEWTGQGVGPWLLGCAVSEAFSRGAVRITLNTCTLDHPAALRSYQKMGFEPVSQEERTLQVPEYMLDLK
jgi:GNAT superfamily N-acetyltransferase